MGKMWNSRPRLLRRLSAMGFTFHDLWGCQMIMKNCHGNLTVFGFGSRIFVEKNRHAADHQLLLTAET
jgi:hypothetical protein